jgi:hypothetical protein
MRPAHGRERPRKTVGELLYGVRRLFDVPTHCQAVGRTKSKSAGRASPALARPGSRSRGSSRRRRHPRTGRRNAVRSPLVPSLEYLADVARPSSSRPAARQAPPPAVRAVEVTAPIPKRPLRTETAQRLSWLRQQWCSTRAGLFNAVRWRGVSLWRHRSGHNGAGRLMAGFPGRQTSDS